MSDNAQAIFEGKEAVDFLEKLQSKIKRTKHADKQLLGILTATVFRDVITHFEDEEGSDGPWDAWSDVYAQHMEKIGRGGNKILQNTGRLRQGFAPAASQSIGEFKWVNSSQTKDGFPYAYAHNEGGGRLPKRDFMWLSDAGLEDVAEKCLNFILEDK